MDVGGGAVPLGQIPGGAPQVAEHAAHASHAPAPHLGEFHAVRRAQRAEQHPPRHVAARHRPGQRHRRRLDALDRSQRLKRLHPAFDQ